MAAGANKTLGQTKSEEAGSSDMRDKEPDGLLVQTAIVREEEIRERGRLHLSFSVVRGDGTSGKTGSIPTLNASRLLSTQPKGQTGFGSRQPRL